jgi:predicted PurR-regulated permease PerM
LVPDWLPWEKILIWGLFFLVVYTLRHFFFIIFMTFLVTYIMRSVVRKVARFVLPGRENIWFERTLSIAGFVLVLFGFYAAGNYLAPKLFLQGKALVNQVTLMEPRKHFDTFLGKVVGPYLFHREYGGRDDSPYLKAFEEFEKRGPVVIAFDSFHDLDDKLQATFEEKELAKIKEQLADPPHSGLIQSRFASWFLREKAPEIFAKDGEALIEEWDTDHGDIPRYLGFRSLEEWSKDVDFENQREKSVKEMIFYKLDEAALAACHEEWKGDVIGASRLALRSAPEYLDRFREFYERAREGEEPTLAMQSLPYDFDQYTGLRKAQKGGREQFAVAVGELVPAGEEERQEQAHLAFEQAEIKDLTQKFTSSTLYTRLEANLHGYIETGVKTLVGWIQGAVAYLVTIPLQLVLALLLSFFITLDIPRLRRGIFMLKQSRVRDFYEEIAPGLYNFGRLIGRTFQAQGLIALFNTILTFVAIRALQIDNEVFLCAIVFVCSFIPVLGVVLSSVPIAIVAIVQPGGDIFLAFKAIGAILAIHFIETSVLNPKILGEMLHLHPVMVLCVLAIGEHFSGVWGLLLAVPVSVYIIRCVILDEEIPGLIEQDPLARVSRLTGQDDPPAATPAENDPPAATPAENDPPAATPAENDPPAATPAENDPPAATPAENATVSAPAPPPGRRRAGGDR